jgi:predicted transcriptional regulator
MKYRSRTEIMGMILECARSGITKTKIMYKVYLSHAQVKEYIALLQDNELLSYEEGTQLYRLSEKGYKFLQSYGEISELIALMPNTTLNF